MVRQHFDRDETSYTALEYKHHPRLREVRPSISLSSDLLWFPGKTQTILAKLMKRWRCRFDNSFFFIYSPSVDAGSQFADIPPHKEKVRRFQMLQEVLEANINRISQGMVGSVQRILVESAARRPGPDGRPEMMGRTECNRKVNFQAGPVGARLMGQFVDVRITDAFSHSLRGQILTDEVVSPSGA